jgi:hypothetical protein
MTAAIEVLEVIVRTPTAQEAAGATIATPPDVWIPRESSCLDAITDGCGNGAAAEITNRFPQRLGNLAQNARFPHFHKPPVVVF